jgi:hypothetical protein
LTDCAKEYLCDGAKVADSKIVLMNSQFYRIKLNEEDSSKIFVERSNFVKLDFESLGSKSVLEQTCLTLIL